jgi:MFS family permease
MVNVCVATLVMTRTEERMRGRVAAALAAVLNGASVVSLAAGGALAAVLAPRQVYLLAGGLGCLVTVALAARSRQRQSTAHSVLPGRPGRARHTGPIAASIGALPRVESMHGTQLRRLHRYFVRR